MESDESIERRHYEFLGRHQNQLAEVSEEIYRDKGRGAWLCDLAAAAVNKRGDKYAGVAYLAASEVVTGDRCWPNPAVEEMVNSYDPESQFVVVIQEKSDQETFDLSIYTLSFAPNAQDREMRRRIVAGKTTPEHG